MTNWEPIITAATTLFLVLDPPGNAPVVQSLLQDLPAPKRKRILLRELFFVLLLLLIFFFLGKDILGWLGISRSTLNLTGGIMLFLISIGMVFPHANATPSHPATPNTLIEPFIVPVAVPLIVGPAAISLVMMQAALCNTAEETAGALFSILLAWAATSVILFFSGKVLDCLGEKGAVAMTRLMGTLLVLMAVQMILNGVTDFIQTLPAPEQPTILHE